MRKNLSVARMISGERKERESRKRGWREKDDRSYSSCCNLRGVGEPRATILIWEGHKPEQRARQEITAAYHHPQSSVERPCSRTEECLEDFIMPIFCGA